MGVAGWKIICTDWISVSDSENGNSPVHLINELYVFRGLTPWSSVSLLHSEKVSQEKLPQQLSER